MPPSFGAPDHAAGDVSPRADLRGTASEVHRGVPVTRQRGLEGVGAWVTGNSLLSGVRVLDFCHFLAGPFATLALADLGADVIKVEDPQHPDGTRIVGPHFRDGESLYFLSLNWAKRSFSVPFSTDAGRRAILDLVKTADAVIDNYRPGVMAKLGLDHETLSSVNPRLITCSLTGFGETGPYAHRPAYDYTIQALSGVMSLTGEPGGPPGKAGISYVDHSAGLAAAFAVAAALVERARTGRGRHLDVSLLDVQISMLTYLAAWQLNAGAEADRTASASHPYLVPAQNFESANGHISLFVGNDTTWQRFVEAMDDDRLRAEGFDTAAGRLAARDPLLAIIAELIGTRTSDYWVELFASSGVPCGRVNSIAEALAEKQVQARGLVKETTDGRNPYTHVASSLAQLGVGGSRPAPLLGEHTTEVLSELGYGTDAIAALTGEARADI